MRCVTPASRGPLVAGPDADEDADRDRAHRLDRLGDDAQAARERRRSCTALSVREMLQPQ